VDPNTKISPRPRTVALFRGGKEDVMASGRELARTMEAMMYGRVDTSPKEVPFKAFRLSVKLTQETGCKFPWEFAEEFPGDLRLTLRICKNVKRKTAVKTRIAMSEPFARG
jgi:hypothetical protein